MASTGGQQDLAPAARTAWPPCNASASGAFVPGCDFDIALAGGVEGSAIPAQRFRLFDGALDVVAERAGPVDGELRAELMADLDGIPETPLRVLSDFGRFGGRAGRPRRRGKTFRSVTIEHFRP